MGKKSLRIHRLEEKQIFCIDVRIFFWNWQIKRKCGSGSSFEDHKGIQSRNAAFYSNSCTFAQREPFLFSASLPGPSVQQGQVFLGIFNLGTVHSKFGSLEFLPKNYSSCTVFLPQNICGHMRLLPSSIPPAMDYSHLIFLCTSIFLLEFLLDKFMWLFFTIPPIQEFSFPGTLP